MFCRIIIWLKSYQKCWIIFILLMFYISKLESKSSEQLLKCKDYFVSQLSDLHKIDYEDSYLLLPVILRHYGEEFSISDSVLQSIFNFQNKEFCIQDNCFNQFQPNSKYLKNLYKKWRNDSFHIDVKLRIASHYNKIGRKPSINQLMSNRQENIYELTHAVFIWYLIKIQVGDTEVIKQWKNILIQEVQNKIMDRKWMFYEIYNNVNLDLLLELFLSLSLLDQLPTELYQELLSYQLYDGSYSKHQQSCLGSTHTTLIALWIFLKGNEKK